MKCEHILKNGVNCRANAMIGSDFCFSHNPLVKKQRLDATRRGGEATIKNVQTLLEPIDLSKPDNALELIQDTINRVRKSNPDGSMEVKTANCIGFLASKMLEIHKFLIDRVIIPKENGVSGYEQDELDSEYDEDREKFIRKAVNLGQVLLQAKEEEREREKHLEDYHKELEQEKINELPPRISLTKAIAK